MEPSSDLLAAIDESTRRYRETEKAHEASRQAVIACVIAALKGGERPTDVVRHSPFTDAYVRRIARRKGVAPAPRGGGPRSDEVVREFDGFVYGSSPLTELP
ncbi:hypothetical protein FLW53_09810 [Microbispora sp. SCL1-1]|uniref:hypothetical protein n=1 Tax=unclassified Microbispora TaxID=2614687 RepID=UPI00115A245D|nr:MULTISPECIES: hypothetical protein [unclassified Microbispora]NJP24502.1 hypothetical protein [Microbispora sp. CL1-1]TQS14646.1 hypothetical protein FLW53_09810 [Microbispora sp. SCL1-1]